MLETCNRFGPVSCCTAAATAAAADDDDDDDDVTPSAPSLCQ